MTKTIQWPAGEFTLQNAVDLNANIPQAEIRKKLAEAIAAKTVVQTKKGNAKVKGTFQVVNVTGSA